LINVEAHWTRVEIFTAYQLVTCEMQLRGRLQIQLNDPEPNVAVRTIEATPLLPGAPKLQGIPEGTLNKNYFGVCSTIEPEPPPVDDMVEKAKRFIYFQGASFTVKGNVEFPAAADPNMHKDMLFKSRYFSVLDASVGVVGAVVAEWQRPLVYVNRDLMVGVYLR
jgi:hypothetical protein